MSVESALGRRLDPPEPVSLRVAFAIFWGIDAIAATLFFLVPYANELNPVTVLFYHVFGLPGVLLAAASYAAVIVVIGHVLSKPLDSLFLALVAVLYFLFATNNVILLALGEPLPDFLGLAV
ncbi:hypothetical protein [Natronolimnohabitans innermongolicus]|uniref:DUF5658 domain-containing protein n=1 Tax=Natronolimnohabitans innermongolicus JCM 12255 TaxID=1227499 RepID=L9X1U2_9EURY|nr:hypothetical protein [Natronolimnohabitans innermongolicus]ELY55567.1 hypothetical protein C493_11407 [Natronolimnohabitans innermongolicus JCM 12255]